MSLNITNKLSLRSLSSGPARNCCRVTAVAQRRPLVFKSFWSRSPKVAEQAEWSPTTTGPTRPTKQEAKQLQEQELKQAKQQEALSCEGSNIGQLDGSPAKCIAVNIDGVPRIFDTVFLRDSCPCPKCRDPDSKQKVFQTSDVPEDLEGSYKMVVDQEKGPSIELEWKNDVKGYGSEHRTRHSIDWLRRALNTEVELRGGVRHDERVLWDREKITKDNKWVDYKEYMSQDDTLFDALTHLNRYGLLFIKNVPDSQESVVDLASRIGTLKDTFYGRTWDVRSKPKAENIAYTPQFLGLHMDLLYTTNPPHLQLLHSLRARTPGGESFFSDSYHAAHQLQRLAASHFRTLCTFPTSLRSFIAASHAYEKLLSAEESLYEYRLNEGECVIFDNRRVLHARRAFDATKGERWLKGAYVDDDVFFSKLRVLEEKYEGKWLAEGVVRHALK
ncbi:Clavaminate synthase-like protein [Cucurbitaria berberidis CBS 394.84]|uniref:Clavaminate synthase-like protein n=1 Tax=Cucurbitaria berberidis CBS 394.84 TaxID=1168544 RepID=A0A9P4G7G4_9PLEO|nr:Clavaminate synthase-like protein [Cucurbitaria berberidis CBS 394.84]KAF1840435.1 Clavaminate synthase-like protein [Cucurbitaria berberidis CBS 394.84]